MTVEGGGRAFLDPATMRFLAWHEAQAHAIGGREVRDLGDCILLHDPREPDPFWNRLSALRLPEDPAEFGRRFDELIAMFARLSRRPHVWASPLHDAPADLAERLVARGFEDLGGGLTMVLVDPGRAVAKPDIAGSVVLEHHRCPQAAGREVLALDLAGLLVAAFRVDPLERFRLAADLEASFDAPEVTLHVARVGDRSVAIAKRTTFDGATYLSSIGTRPGWEGRGLGALVTVDAVQAGLADGGGLEYLGVFADNERRLALYRRLGFATVGGPAGDFLLP